jgi:hypothetical protein
MKIIREIEKFSIGYIFIASKTIVVTEQELFEKMCLFRENNVLPWCVKLKI